MKKIAIASDHAGYEYKKLIKNHLIGKYEITDYGTHSLDSVDYPDFVHPAAQSIVNNENELGLLICGSGNGVQMTANKYQKVRCALCWEVELAELCRQHNNCNMMAIPARFISPELTLKMVDAFLNTEFEGGRHQNRVDKITCC